MKFDPELAESETRSWLVDVVVGLNLCPFASKPHRAGAVRFICSKATKEEVLLEDLQKELCLLAETPIDQIETTLLIVPHFLHDFYEYNQFLEWVDRLLRRENWEGVIQVASFHPDYCFAGTEPEDAENLTNRAPYPTLHLIREDRLEEVLAKHPDSDQIPETNIAKMNQLSPKDKQRLFPYLFG